MYLFPCSFAIVIWGVLTQKKPFAGERTCLGLMQLLLPEQWRVCSVVLSLCQKCLQITVGAALGRGAGGPSGGEQGCLVLPSRSAQRPTAHLIAGFRICRQGALPCSSHTGKGTDLMGSVQ